MAKNLVRCIYTGGKQEEIKWIPRHLTQDNEYMRKNGLFVQEPIKMEEIGKPKEVVKEFVEVKPVSNEIETFIEEENKPETEVAPKNKGGRLAKN